jgi:hypothetical protein
MTPPAGPHPPSRGLGCLRRRCRGPVSFAAPAPHAPASAKLRRATISRPSLPVAPPPGRAASQRLLMGVSGVSTSTSSARKSRATPGRSGPGLPPAATTRRRSSSPQEREIGTEACGVADLGQCIGAALRREPRGKELVEQDGKLPCRLCVRLGLRLCTHTDTPRKPARPQEAQEPCAHPRVPHHQGQADPHRAGRTSPRPCRRGEGNWH